MLYAESLCDEKPHSSCRDLLNKLISGSRSIYEKKVYICDYMYILEKSIDAPNGAFKRDCMWLNDVWNAFSSCNALVVLVFPPLPSIQEF